MQFTEEERKQIDAAKETMARDRAKREQREVERASAPRMTSEELSGTHEFIKNAASQYETFSDCSGRSYVKFFFQKNDVLVLPTGNVLIEKEQLTEETLERKIVLDYQVDYQAYKQNGSASRIKESIIRLAIGELYDSEAKSGKNRERFIALFPFFEKTQSTAHNGMSELVEILTGKKDEAAELVLEQWIWQVKRKIKGLPTFNNIVPVLVGPPDLGKTGFLQIFLAPLSDFAGDHDLADLMDVRSLPILAKKFAIVLDEFSGIAKVDMARFKKIITATTHSTRKFHSQDDFTFPVNASFIATSNFSLKDQIFDTSGVRRFFEIPVTGMINFPRLKEFDMLALWQSIDETKESPLDKNKLLIRQRQADIRNYDDVTNFLLEAGAIALDEIGAPQKIPGRTAFIDKDTLYRVYRRWSERTGTKLLPLTVIGRKMKSLGFDTERKRVDGGSPRGFQMYQEAVQNLEKAASSNSILDDIADTYVNGTYRAAAN